MKGPSGERSITRDRGFKSRRPDSVRVSAGHRPAGTLFILLGMNARSSTPLLDSLTQAGCRATTGSSKADHGAVPDLGRVPAGLGRSLRAGNYPETTRYNYLLAAAQLARYPGEYSPDPDAEAAAENPCVVTRAHVEAFQAWMIETRSASTALNKHIALRSPGQHQQLPTAVQRNRNYGRVAPHPGGLALDRGDRSPGWGWRPSHRRPCCARKAPRGAWLYPRVGWEEVEGTFPGLMAYLDPKGEGDGSMPGKRRLRPGCTGRCIAGPRLACLPGRPCACIPVGQWVQWVGGVRGSGPA